jgi:hypothetical protein
MIKIVAETHCPRSIFKKSQDRRFVENPLSIRVPGVFCTTKEVQKRGLGRVLKPCDPP